MNHQDTFTFTDFLYFGRLAGFHIPGNLAPRKLAPKKRQPEMISPKNDKIIERHGCIVCARVFNILVVYARNGRVVDCAVTDPGGHCVPSNGQPLAACDTHTEEEIDTAYQRWRSRNN